MKSRIALGIWVFVIGLTGAVANAAETNLVTSGMANLAYGKRTCLNTDDVDCGSHGGFAVDGRLSFPLGDRFSVQGDLQYETYSGAEESSGQVMEAATVGMHLSWRNPDSFLVGMFLGMAQSGVDDNDDAPSGPEGRYTGSIGGIEGQLYLSRFTLYAQYGSSDLEQKDNSFVGPVARVVIRYYPTDNLLIQLDGSKGESEDGYEDEGDWGEVRNSAFEVKMKVMDSVPLYAFVRHQRGEYVANTEDSGEESATFIGVSYAFGSAKSLFDNDRRGATLDLPMLPSRAASWAGVLD